MRFGVKKKLISMNPAEGINLPKHIEKKKRGVRSIDTQKTLTIEQIKILLEKSIEEVLSTEENEKALESELLGIVIDTAAFME